MSREVSASSSSRELWPEHKVSVSSELNIISYKSDVCEIKRVPVKVKIKEEEDRMYEMLKKLRRSMPKLMNEEQAMMNFVKGMAGTGDLSLPLAFYNAGLWTGFVCMIFVIIINTYAMRILIRSSQKLCFIYNVPSADYGETAELSMKHGPAALRSRAKWGRIAVNTFLIINQVGSICIYYLFISENLKEGLDPGNTLSLIDYMLIMLVPLLLLCSIRHLKYLAYFTAMANVVLLVAIVIMVQYMVRDLPPTSRLPAFNSWSTLPLFFGSAMFAFQGINTISAIESRSLRPRNVIKWNGVLNTSCVLVAVLYIMLGFFGYVKFGDKVMGTVTLNLPMEEPLYRATKVMFALSILFTYPVQFYVPISVAARHIEVKYGVSRKQLIIEYAFRYSLVTFSFAVAALLPHLGLIISLIGSFAGSAIALLFPGAIYFVTYHLDNARDSRWYFQLIITVFLMLIGLLGMTTGSYAAITGLIEALQKGGYS